MNFKKIAWALTLLMSLAQAQNASPIIDSIKKSGEIILGHGERAIPFTYLIDGESTPLGFGHDIELMIVEHLKQKLNLPDLKIKYQMVNFSNAVAQVSKSEVHLNCGIDSNLVERQKDFNFSNAYFVATTRLLVRKDSGLKSLNEMKGKKVASLDNTWSINFARSKKAQFGLKEVHGYNRIEDIVKALNTGEMDGFFMGDGILAGIQVQLENPADWHIVGKGAGSQRYACIMPKTDDQFKALVDEALAKYYASGEVYKLYDKWFMNPIKPKGVAVGFEMTDATRRILIAPTDKAIGQN